jgi:hypothetical protein
MLNNEISRNPITDLAIPPDPPKAVLTAREPFDRLADELSDTIDERRAAERDALQAESAAIRQAADDYAAGQQPDDPGEAARPHRERARTAETKIAALRLAVDDAGNRYADAIAEHADPWAAKLRKREADALAAYRAALDTALAALTNLAAARAGADWLDGFDAIQAHHGRVQPFPGGRIRIKTRETIQRGDIDPRKLLAIAATVAEPTSAPQKAAAA